MDTIILNDCNKVENCHFARKRVEPIGVAVLVDLHTLSPTHQPALEVFNSPSTTHSLLTGDTFKIQKYILREVI